MHISGANTGIGKITAIDLARRGAKVIICCRSMERAEAAVKDIQAESGSNLVEISQLDLASLKSVRQCADDLNNRLDKIDYLINNAGIMMCPQWSTEDGFDMQMGTNHFGHFLLTELLMPLIRKSAASGHRPRYLIWLIFSTFDDSIFKKIWGIRRIFRNPGNFWESWESWEYGKHGE